jgi:hypothetical protein
MFSLQYKFLSFSLRLEGLKSQKVLKILAVAALFILGLVAIILLYKYKTEELELQRERMAQEYQHRRQELEYHHERIKQDLEIQREGMVRLQCRYYHMLIILSREARNHIF